jgi:UrcA family protein
MLRIFAAAALLALTVTTAEANVWPEVSVPVAYGDLNLSKPADAKILADRLQAAATLACFNANSDLNNDAHTTPAIHKEMQACVKDAINVAMLRIERSLTQNVRANLSSNKQASLN